MLTSIQSAGVAPEMNLRITQAKKHASPKQGYQWPYEKDLCPQKSKIERKAIRSLSRFDVGDKIARDKLVGNKSNCFFGEQAK